MTHPHKSDKSGPLDGIRIVEYGVFHAGPGGTAITISHAIITALFVRERSGMGQEIHASLFGTALWLQHPNMMLANVLNVDPCVRSERHEHSPLRNHFQCKDGQWIIGTHHPEEKYWRTFCRLTDMTELLDDDRFTDNVGRPIPGAELLERFDKIVTSFSW